MSRGYLDDYAAVGVSDSCGVRVDLLGAQAGRATTYKDEGSA